VAFGRRDQSTRECYAISIPNARATATFQEGVKNLFVWLVDCAVSTIGPGSTEMLKSVVDTSTDIEYYCQYSSAQSTPHSSNAAITRKTLALADLYP
jgi:hypothetical protein